MKILAQRLKEVRLENGLTQKKLAEELGIPLKTYKNYEAVGTGHTSPSLETVVILAKRLNTTSDFLLGLEN